MDIAKLPNSSTVPRGRRYTAEEKEAAYDLWRIAAGRSCTAVARRLGIERNTIMAWRDSEGWVARADQEDTEAFGASKHGVAALVVTELVANIETAKEIRDDKTASNKDRLAAAQWLAGLAGVSPVSKIEQAVTDHRQLVEVESLPDFSTMSHDELRAWEEAQRKKRQRKTMVATERTRT